MSHPSFHAFIHSFFLSLTQKLCIKDLLCPRHPALLSGQELRVYRGVKALLHLWGPCRGSAERSTYYIKCDLPQKALDISL